MICGQRHKSRHNQYVTIEKPHHPLYTVEWERFCRVGNDKDRNTHGRSNHTNIEELALDNPNQIGSKPRFINSG
jgi:hypothetical protein